MCSASIGVHYPRLLCSFGGARTPPRAFLFPHDLFWSTGKHLRQLRGDGPPPGPRLLVRAGRCSPSRASPSPVNYACLFLPLPLSLRSSSSPPSLPFRLRRAASCVVFLSPSLVTIPCTLPFLFPSPLRSSALYLQVLISFILLPSCQLLAFLRVF